MIDYSLRSAVLKTDLVKNIKYIKSLQFYNPHIASDLQDSLDDLKNENPLYFDTACKIIESDRSRNKRLKLRIKRMLNIGHCIFLTLTFTDEVLISTSPETRRRYVTRLLKSLSDYYVANIDWGKRNTEREHYHAIIVADYYDQSSWSYGFSKGKPIFYNTDNPIALAKYIAKLTNHAVKESCRRAQIIYSKKTYPET